MPVSPVRPPAPAVTSNDAPKPGASTGGYRYSETVVRSVMDQFDVTDRSALLAKAAGVDDGNKYLKRSELESAAKLLAQRAVETGVVSDLDSTIIPAHTLGQPMPKPYPGVVALLNALDTGAGGKTGDVNYVTARNAERITDVPAYLEEHGLPVDANGIDTGGASSAPWVAQAEKVKDIVALFEANPEQKFVLFGDTKHRDPEVYKEIQRLYPERVLAVVIHKQTATVSASRVEGLHLVENYAEAAARLFKGGVIDETAARSVVEAARADGLELTDTEVEALFQ